MTGPKSRFSLTGVSPTDERQLRSRVPLLAISRGLSESHPLAISPILLVIPRHSRQAATCVSFLTSVQLARNMALSVKETAA
jgi:hypothetical protein